MTKLKLRELKLKVVKLRRWALYFALNIKILKTWAEFKLHYPTILHFQVVLFIFWSNKLKAPKLSYSSPIYSKHQD